MRLEITCQDRLGIAQDVLDILVNHQIDLRGIELDKIGKIFLNFPNIAFEDFQHLMPKIRLIDGIEDVKTTPFMPIERDKYQLQTLLKASPDLVFSIDTKANIASLNESAKLELVQGEDDIVGLPVSDFIKGVNITKWLEQRTPELHYS